MSIVRSAFRVTARFARIALLGIGLFINFTRPVFAAETSTFHYDALGRLIGTDHVGGTAAGMVTSFGYDPAGNRKSTSVTGSPGPRPSVFVVVPLNGFTVIPVIQK